MTHLIGPSLFPFHWLTLSLVLTAMIIAVEKVGVLFRLVRLSRRMPAPTSTPAAT